jgi:hypothetical protein
MISLEKNPQLYIDTDDARPLEKAAMLDTDSLPI